MSAHERPHFGRRGLSLERIVSETLALIDEQGIASASMRSVGERLGVRAMSLYRYVPNREELFDAVVERVVDELASDPHVLDAPDNGWRDYLSRLALGVRRFALAHPHAFPLVATRPPGAPWVNPPLRSLRWIESLLNALAREGFSEDEMLFAYRSFNTFLLGHLLLETSAMALRDPKPGDGSFQSGSSAEGTDPVEPSDPVPGALSPARGARQRRAADRANTASDRIDPNDEVDLSRYPWIVRLRAGLTQERYDSEFHEGLDDLLDRIAAYRNR